MHVRRGDDVILVGIEGSPSMGVHVTSSDPERGGRPEWPDGTDELSPGSGIFIEEIAAELAERGVPTPRAMGISHQLPDHDPAGERAALGISWRLGRWTPTGAASASRWLPGSS